MIKAKQVFFWTSNLKGHGFHGDKATILYLTLKYYSLSVLSGKLYFLEIGPVNQKLWPFKCMVLKTLNSNFLDWEDTLKGWLKADFLSWQKLLATIFFQKKSVKW